MFRFRFVDIFLLGRWNSWFDVDRTREQSYSISFHMAGPGNGLKYYQLTYSKPKNRGHLRLVRALALLKMPWFRVWRSTRVINCLSIICICILRTACQEFLNVKYNSIIIVESSLIIRISSILVFVVVKYRVNAPNELIGIQIYGSLVLKGLIC